MPFLFMQNPRCYDISGAVGKAGMFILPADPSEQIVAERLEWELFYFA